jgi:serine/threonine-protein kinase
MIGETVSHYRISEKLDEGGMGVAWKARDSEIERFVTLKSLPAGKIAQESRRSRFLQEARAASSLNHPNIVTTRLS